MTSTGEIVANIGKYLLGFFEIVRRTSRQRYAKPASIVEREIETALATW